MQILPQVLNMLNQESAHAKVAHLLNECRNGTEVIGNIELSNRLMYALKLYLAEQQGYKHFLYTVVDSSFKFLDPYKHEIVEDIEKRELVGWYLTEVPEFMDSGFWHIPRLIECLKLDCKSHAAACARGEPQELKKAYRCIMPKVYAVRVGEFGRSKLMESGTSGVFLPKYLATDSRTLDDFLAEDPLPLG
jgi:hypothetical protein